MPTSVGLVRRALSAFREFPANPDAYALEQQAEWYLIAAWATPDQLGSDLRIKGSNVNPDGTVVNHGKSISPDYMLSDAEFVAKAALIAASAHTPTPLESTNNFRRIWSALTAAEFDSPPCAPPGGTIYRRAQDGATTAELHYPLGAGWSLRRRHPAR